MFATLPLIQQPKRESEKLYGLIRSFDVRGSTLVVGMDNRILSLNADSLQSMADAMKFFQVHNSDITSLLFSKDGKYYLFTFIMYLYTNYDLYIII